MLRFKAYLVETAKEGKNLHLEHLEDEVLNHGIDGTRAAINFLQSLREMLAFYQLGTGIVTEPSIPIASMNKA